ncbi:hypothetical protein Ahy_A01g000184 [Arachis hypogaea]|uniref:Transposase MuDR plant domain-containing protein n=1 Tax=Arachis hypogaea TaxID=3818 RepID=A0A445EJR5_ARAHY|nr:hypothetical protein Ahy_A01g000184 [Arachis hypogaea]
MDNRVLLKVYYFVFSGFVQFQTKYVTDDASMQEMFSMYIESRALELYIEFEQLKADQNIEREDYNSDSEEELERNYEVIGPDGNEDQGDDTMAPNATDVVNALANEHPFEEPSFMRVLDLEAMYAPEFLECMNAEISIVTDGEFVVGMKFSFREAVIMAMKDYTIRRGVDYRMYESESLTFIAKCTQYGSGCDGLIRVSMIIRKATISQDHSKLDSNIIAEVIKPRSSITPSAIEKHDWLSKSWKASYETLPIWFEDMCHKEPSAVVHFETMPAYQYDDLVTDIRVLHRVFWSYYPCIRAFRHCKPVVQVDEIHLYRKYKSCLLVAVLQDGNNNIRERTYDAWHFFLNNLQQHVVTWDGVGLIFDRHKFINAVVACSNGAWSPPRAFHMFCIRHIESNFFRKFKAPYLQKLVVNIGYSKTVREYNCVTSIYENGARLTLTS